MIAIYILRTARRDSLQNAVNYFSEQKQRKREGTGSGQIQVGRVQQPVEHAAQTGVEVFLWIRFAFFMASHRTGNVITLISSPSRNQQAE